MSSTALPMLAASGLPPNVVPCVPAVIPFAASRVERKAPSGNPPPMPLAIAMMSGMTPKAHRQTACQCGRRQTAPRRTAKEGHVRRKDRATPAKSAAAPARMPPSPWIGSIKMAPFADRWRLSPPRCRQRAPCRSPRPADRNLQDIWDFPPRRSSPGCAHERPLER